MSPSSSLALQTMSSTSFETFYTANTSPSHSSMRQTVKTASTNNSYDYSVTSINSRKSRNNVLYPRRVHRPPVTTLPECIDSPDMLTWEVRYLCATLLPHSETRLLPAGIVLLKSLGQERSFSQHENEEIHHCSELFVVLTREILLKDAVGVMELEGPCKLLHLTFRDTLFKSRAFRVGDTPTTSSLNGMDLWAPRAETQGAERFAGVVRALLYVMDAFELWTCSVLSQRPHDGSISRSAGSEACAGPFTPESANVECDGATSDS
ncbi:hypothetical protein H4582DRAFT_649236 [Lactarius indigo]|nr:hypothetical protein H4582DRAFT_649236 [Lactarius indigo]